MENYELTVRIKRFDNDTKGKILKVPVLASNHFHCAESALIIFRISSDILSIEGFKRENDGVYFDVQEIYGDTINYKNDSTEECYTAMCDNALEYGIYGATND